MKGEYKRDLQNNYLILELEKEREEDGYCLKMAEENEIRGLLPFHSSRKDGKRNLYYEITSRQTLESMYERRSVGYQDILNILTDIRDIVEEMQRFLLEPAHLIFDPAYIFVGVDKRACFCYFPQAMEENQILVLAEFILKKLNHEEISAVDLGYRFYKNVCQENFSLSRIWMDMVPERGETQTEKKFWEEKLTGSSDRSQEKWKEPEQEAVDKASENFYAGEMFDGSGYDQMEESYEVIHKERKSKKKKVSKQKEAAEWFFQRVHPVVFLSGLFLFAVIEGLFYFKVIYLTEAGGMFFLTISVELLLNKFLLRKRDRKRKHQEKLNLEEEERNFQELREEMYQIKTEPEEIGLTQCLTSLPRENGIRLIHISGDGVQNYYPDIKVEQAPVYIGKIKGESDVILDSPTVSRVHAKIECKEERYFVKDLNSRNGTFCNDEKLHPQEQREIFAGDRIAFAQVEYRVVQIRN